MAFAEFAGSAHLARGAAAYAAEHGARHRASDFARTVIAPHEQERLAREYEAAPVHDEGALPAFHAMHREVQHQFDYLTRPQRRGGLGISVEVTQHDPYHNAGEMMRDISENRRLQVLSTQSTGGHPVFGDEGNDMFRAVHDAFGHAATGRGFDRHGEEAAYQSHARMFSNPLARQALATETRGQNAHLIRRGYFSDQKTAVLPTGTRPLAVPPPEVTHRLLQQSRQFNGAMGL